MPHIYVLNVPEFIALVEVARKKPACVVTEHGRNYFKISSDDVLEFSRKELGFKPAIWYGSLTGGLAGKITRFDREQLRIERDDL
ncbi:hypothetical protein [Noviherbaspirillum denitrificans]|uniref:hypothetical protein n=1 Tax=Noviherbaspirillum denitrificans TaxID=1968433 RepID=UPI001F2160F8|nr:hypothetical protein [Noviherbaspirillum denitrificans]